MHLLGTNCAGRLHYDAPLHPVSPVFLIRQVVPWSERDPHFSDGLVSPWSASPSSPSNRRRTGSADTGSVKSYTEPTAPPGSSTRIQPTRPWKAPKVVSLPMPQAPGGLTAGQQQLLDYKPPGLSAEQATIYVDTVMAAPCLSRSIAAWCRSTPRRHPAFSRRPRVEQAVG